MMLMTSRLSRPGRDKKYNYNSLKDKAEKCERQYPSRTHANNMIIRSLHQDTGSFQMSLSSLGMEKDSLQKSANSAASLLGIIPISL